MPWNHNTVPRPSSGDEACQHSRCSACPGRGPALKDAVSRFSCKHRGSVAGEASGLSLAPAIGLFAAGCPNGRMHVSVRGRTGFSWNRLCGRAKRSGEALSCQSTGSLYEQAQEPEQRRQVYED